MSEQDPYITSVKHRIKEDPFTLLGVLLLFISTIIDFVKLQQGGQHISRLSLGIQVAAALLIIIGLVRTTVKSAQTKRHRQD